MGRIRTIKPEFWTDSFMVQLPHFGRLFYIALWSAADDFGFVVDEPDRLAMQLMPKEDPLDVDDWLQFFAASGRLEVYVDANGRYLKLTNWERHQRVDKPSKSRIYREGAKKMAIPTEARRVLAEKYGCKPGHIVPATCYYCGAKGSVHWHRLSDGRPSYWVTFPGLEIDHLEAEVSGGEGAAANLVLACRYCNRSKGTDFWLDKIALPEAKTRPFASPREVSCVEVEVEVEVEGTKEGKGPRTKAGVTPAPPVELPPIPPVLDSAEFNAAWNRWLTYRRDRRLSTRPMTLAAQLKKLAGYGPAKALRAIEDSICNGWQGLFEPKENAGGKSRISTGPDVLYDPSAELGTF